MCSHVASGSWVLAKHSDWNKQVHDFEISTLEAPSRIVSDGDPECLVPPTRTPYAYSATGSWVLAKLKDWNKTFNDFEISRLKAPSCIISDQDLECLHVSIYGPTGWGRIASVDVLPFLDFSYGRGFRQSGVIGIFMFAFGSRIGTMFHKQ